MAEQLETRIGTILIGIASGLVAMSIVTPFYAIWAGFAWPVVGGLFFVAAGAFSFQMARLAARLRRLGRSLPHELNAADQRISKLQAIVGGIQGGLILLSSLALALLGYWTWILPVVALVVGLHFFAMPWIFDRTIDYYLGSAMVLVAGLGCYLAARPDVSWQLTWGLVGIGGALVTSSYGLWMGRTARQTLRDYERLP